MSAGGWHRADVCQAVSAPPRRLDNHAEFDREGLVDELARLAAELHAEGLLPPAPSDDDDADE